MLHTICRVTYFRPCLKGHIRLARFVAVHFCCKYYIPKPYVLKTTCYSHKEDENRLKIVDCTLGFECRFNIASTDLNDSNIPFLLLACEGATFVDGALWMDYFTNARQMSANCLVFDTKGVEYDCTRRICTTIRHANLLSPESRSDQPS